jgi:hypothetical protein
MRLITPEPFLFVWLLLFITLLLTWFKAIREIVRTKFDGPNEKLLWVLAVVFLPFLGTLLYFTIGRKASVTDNQK